MFHTFDLEPKDRSLSFSFHDHISHEISTPVARWLTCMRDEGLLEMLIELLPEAFVPGKALSYEFWFSNGQFDYSLDMQSIHGPFWGVYQHPYRYVVCQDSRDGVSELFYCNCERLGTYFTILWSYYQQECGYSFEETLNCIYQDLCMV